MFPPPPPATFDIQPLGHSYEGCFRDTWFGLELANMPMDDYTDTSHETCKQHCDAAEYAYYALEFGFGCSCGNHLPEASTKAPDDECSVVRKKKEKKNCVFCFCVCVLLASTETPDGGGGYAGVYRPRCTRFIVVK